MIARLLIIPFGSIWRLKKRCQNSQFSFMRKLYIFLYQLYQYENCSSIAWDSTIEGEPCFPHGIKSIFISGEAKIGKNCVIFQQVTIGSVILLDSKSTGAPTIGEDCYIGAGAKIIGNVKIGNNVRIGANAIVYKDVPDNSVVVAGEQKVITKNFHLDNKFYSFHGEWVYFINGKWKPVLSLDALDSLKKIRDS